MKFTLDKKDRYVVIQPDVTRITNDVAPDFKAELVLLNKEGYRNIICDLSTVEYVDSSGLSALIIGNRLCSDADGVFVLCAPTSGVHKLVELAKLTEVFTIIPTVSESVDYILLQELERDLR